MAGGAFGQGSCDIRGVIGVADDDLRLGQEGLAFTRELDASAVALQELEPKLTSRLRICWLNAGCEMNKRCAARAQRGSDATATK